MKNNKKNFKQIIYGIIITLMLIILAYATTRNNNYIGELPTEDIIKSEELQIYFFNVGQADCILVRSNGKNMLIDAGDKFELGEAKCEIKSIDNSDPASSSKINSTSIVIQMEANNNKYLFMGDAEDNVETNSKITWEDIDVLKVGHHGSDTSSTEQFINKVLPEMAIISVNSNTNSYGHPSETVIKRLQDKECEIYRTDMNGTILLINENGTNKVQMLDTKVNAGK